MQVIQVRHSPGKINVTVSYFTAHYHQSVYTQHDIQIT